MEWCGEVTKNEFCKIKDHWAILVLSEESFEKASRIVNNRTKLLQSKNTEGLYETCLKYKEDTTLLDNISSIYEMCIIDLVSEPNWIDDEIICDKVRILSALNYEILKLKALPNKDLPKIDHTIQLSIFGSMGERGKGLQNEWYSAYSTDLRVCEDESRMIWIDHIWKSIFYSWWGIFTSDKSMLASSLSDLAKLRDMQTLHEKEYLMAKEFSKHYKDYLLYLISLYYLVKITEIISEHVLDDYRPLTKEDIVQLEKMMEHAKNGAQMTEFYNYAATLNWMNIFIIWLTKNMSKLVV